MFKFKKQQPPDNNNNKQTQETHGRSLTSSSSSSSLDLHHDQNSITNPNHFTPRTVKKDGDRQFEEFLTKTDLKAPGVIKNVNSNNGGNSSTGNAKTSTSPSSPQSSASTLPSTASGPIALPHSNKANNIALKPTNTTLFYKPTPPAKPTNIAAALQQKQLQQQQQSKSKDQQQQLPQPPPPTQQPTPKIQPPLASKQQKLYNPQRVVKELSRHGEHFSRMTLASEEILKAVRAATSQKDTRVKRAGSIGKSKPKRKVSEKRTSGIKESLHNLVPTAEAQLPVISESAQQNTEIVVSEKVSEPVALPQQSLKRQREEDVEEEQLGTKKLKFSDAEQEPEVEKQTDIVETKQKEQITRTSQFEQREFTFTHPLPFTPTQQPQQITKLTFNPIVPGSMESVSTTASASAWSISDMQVKRGSGEVVKQWVATPSPLGEEVLLRSKEEVEEEQEVGEEEAQDVGQAEKQEIVQEEVQQKEEIVELKIEITQEEEEPKSEEEQPQLVEPKEEQQQPITPLTPAIVVPISQTTHSLIPPVILLQAPSVNGISVQEVIVSPIEIEVVQTSEDEQSDSDEVVVDNVNVNVEIRVEVVNVVEEVEIVQPESSVQEVVQPDVQIIEEVVVENTTLQALESIQEMLADTDATTKSDQVEQETQPQQETSQQQEEQQQLPQQEVQQEQQRDETPKPIITTTAETFQPTEDTTVVTSPLSQTNDTTISPDSPSSPNPKEKPPVSPRKPSLTPRRPSATTKPEFKVVDIDMNKSEIRSLGTLEPELISPSQKHQEEKVSVQEFIHAHVDEILQSRQTEPEHPAKVVQSEYVQFNDHRPVRPWNFGTIAINDEQLEVKRMIPVDKIPGFEVRGVWKKLNWGKMIDGYFASMKQQEEEQKQKQQQLLLQQQQQQQLQKQQQEEQQKKDEEEANNNQQPKQLRKRRSTLIQDLPQPTNQRLSHIAAQAKIEVNVARHARLPVSVSPANSYVITHNEIAEVSGNTQLEIDQVRDTASIDNLASTRPVASSSSPTSPNSPLIQRERAKSFSRRRSTISSSPFAQPPIAINVIQAITSPTTTTTNSIVPKPIIAPIVSTSSSSDPATALRRRKSSITQTIQTHHKSRVQQLFEELKLLTLHVRLPATKSLIYTLNLTHTHLSLSSTDKPVTIPNFPLLLHQILSVQVDPHVPRSCYIHAVLPRKSGKGYKLRTIELDFLEEAVMKKIVDALSWIIYNGDPKDTLTKTTVAVLSSKITATPTPSPTLESWKKHFLVPYLLAKKPIVILQDVEFNSATLTKRLEPVFSTASAISTIILIPGEGESVGILQKPMTDTMTILCSNEWKWETEQRSIHASTTDFMEFAWRDLKKSLVETEMVEVFCRKLVRGKKGLHFF